MASRIGAVEVITTAEAAQRLETEWDELATAFARTPFALPALALTWWRHLGDGELCIVAARARSGQLLAVAPLHIRRLGALRVARWLGSGLGTVSELVTRPDEPLAAAAVWDAVADRTTVMDLLAWRHDGAGLMELRRAEGWTSRLHITDVCPVVDLRQVDDVADHLSGRSNLRKKLARYDRAVAATGAEFTVEVVSRHERALALLSELDEVYDRAEQVHARQHLLAPPYRDFVLDVFERTSARDQLAIFVGRLGDRVIAFDVAIRIGATLADWFGRYVPDVEELSPGHLLIREILGWGLEHEVETLDLLIGDHEYKRRWSTSSYDTIDVMATNGSLGRTAGVLVDSVRASHPLRARLGRHARRGARC